MKGKESIAMAYYPVYIRKDQIADLKKLRELGRNPAHLVREGIDSELDPLREQGILPPKKKGFGND